MSQPASIDVRRDDGLRAAIVAANGVNNLARQIGVTSQAISQWERVPADRVRAVVRATGVPDWRLRPDLYEIPTLQQPTTHEAPR